MHNSTDEKKLPWHGERAVFFTATYPMIKGSQVTPAARLVQRGITKRHLHSMSALDTDGQWWPWNGEWGGCVDPQGKDLVMWMVFYDNIKVGKTSPLKRGKTRKSSSEHTSERIILKRANILCFHARKASSTNIHLLKQPVLMWPIPNWQCSLSWYLFVAQFEHSNCCEEPLKWPLSFLAGILFLWISADVQ